MKSIEIILMILFNLSLFRRVIQVKNLHFPHYSFRSHTFIQPARATIKTKKGIQIEQDSRLGEVEQRMCNVSKGTIVKDETGALSSELRSRKS